MSVSNSVALVISILGLAQAIQNYILVDYYLKLFTLALTALLVVFIWSQRLVEWVAVRPVSSAANPAVHRRNEKRAKSVLALFVFCLTYVLTGVFVLNAFAINVTAESSNGKRDYWIIASYQVASKIAVKVPNPPTFQTSLMDAPGDPSVRANAFQEGWQSPTPLIWLYDFVVPQRQGISCDATAPIESVELHPTPATIQVLYPERRRQHLRLILIVGGVLWLASGLYVLCRS